MKEIVRILDGNKAQFVCPECKKTKPVDVSKYMDIEEAIKLKVKCGCKHVYTAILCKRDIYRKRRNTILTGAYTNITDGKEGQKGSLTVLDISRTGLKTRISQLKVKVKDHEVHAATDKKANFAHKMHKTIGKLGIGDIILVEFNLDDAKKSSIKREGTIRWINHPLVGIEFINLPMYDGALGFYLMS
jgi:hypothetical protein